MTQLKPQEILEATMEAAVRKSQLSIRRMILLGIMAGAFIALAGSGANMAGYYLLSDPATNGMGKMLSGCIFPAGLILVVFTGAELFTGNNLMVTALLDKRISLGAMLRNWIIVYIANLAGSVLIAWMVAYCGLLETGDGMLKEVTISIAAAKTALPFGKAFVRAIMCNFLVCLAVWLSTAADSTIGKIFSIFFPIWLFVTAGFEHSSSEHVLHSGRHLRRRRRHSRTDLGQLFHREPASRHSGKSRRRKPAGRRIVLLHI